MTIIQLLADIFSNLESGKIKLESEIVINPQIEIKHDEGRYNCVDIKYTGVSYKNSDSRYEITI